MQKLVWQNSIGDSVDLTKTPYGITNWEGFSNTSLNIQSQQVPFQDGGVFLDALMEQRELTVTLAMYDGNDLENRYRMRRELIHALNPKLGEGYLIYTNDFISKRIKCVPQIPLFETHNSNDSGTPKASLAWTACEPYWEDLEESEVMLSIDGVEIINNGDVPANIKIEFDCNDGQEVFVSPNIYNESTGKYINVNGVYSCPVVINTNNGQKTAYCKELVLQEIENNNPVSKLQYSKLLKHNLLLQGGVFKMLLDDGSYEIIKNEVSDFICFDDMILVINTDSTSEISNDLQTWIVVSSSWKAMRKIGANSYEIYKASTEKLYYSTLNISGGVATIGTWLEETYFDNYYFVFENIVIYNPILDGIVVFAREENDFRKYCFIKKNGQWNKKGWLNYPSDYGYLVFLDETNSMLIFGTQYGDIVKSSDGETWENFTIIGTLRTINYIKEKGFYIAGGLDWASYSPLLATSRDLINWTYIDYKEYAKSEQSGSIADIVYNIAEDIFYMSTNYINKQNQDVYMIKTNLQEEKNIINNISGDMNFNLVLGKNKLYINNVKGKVTYRQKYIGV